MISIAHPEPLLLLKRMKRLNWPLIWLITAMGLIGLMMMVSVGGGELREYAVPQAVRFVFCFFLMLGVAVTPMHLLLRYAYIIYFIGVAALVVVDVIGHTGMGAQRWVRLGGMNFQPSEMMKIAVILALARYFHMLHMDDVRRFIALIPPIFILIVPAIFILRQPNLGTTVITLAVGGSMLFLAGVQWRYFIGVAAAGIAAGPVVWHFMHDYQRRRVLTFLDPEQDPLGAGYNIMQSMIAVGSGGMFGKGFLNGSQGQLNFLPEKHTDFIFTVLAEEWGFGGSLILLALYGALLAAALSVAATSRSSFGAMLAGGIAAFLFLHVLINVAMVMGLLPVVGLPLPFLSYGGSIMLSTMIGMGLLLNADLHRNQQVSVSREFTERS